jgi:hypothetical protein
LYIRYLRQKIEPDPARPRYILTEWGIGYRFREITPPPRKSEQEVWSRDAPSPANP